ncbi:hypothetical protein AB1Y20_000863 [Prymnesium parvum]|uniref:Beta-galactosidase n=1 Tax=Prymnesium parvum TaxID=97485 RepID=A0AB34K6N8_PRYPA
MMMLWLAALTPPQPFTSRRVAITGGASVLLAPFARSVAAQSSQVLATGTVRLQIDAPQADNPQQALYVTVRLVPQNNVGRYITAGKVPPLAAARFPSPTFPFDFSMSMDSVTPEFAHVPRAEWDSQDLVVSARLDTDGVAATRDPADLVGRGLIRKSGTDDPNMWTPADVELQGRGLTGRLLTGGK